MFSRDTLFVYNCYAIILSGLDSLYCYSVSHTHTLIPYTPTKRQGCNYHLLSHYMFYVFYSLLSAILSANALHTVAFNPLPIRQTLIKLLILLMLLIYVFSRNNAAQACQHDRAVSSVTNNVTVKRPVITRCYSN